MLYMANIGRLSMKAYEIMNQIVGEGFYESMAVTVDVLKIGDKEREVKKLAMCHMATPDVIRQAAEWGADMLITHEPVYYNHMDNFAPWIMSTKKRELLETAGFPVYRYHDAMHIPGKDEIGEAFIERTGLIGKFDGDVSFVADKAISAKELARIIGEKLGIRHIRLVGDIDTPSEKITLALGSRGNKCVIDMLQSPDIGIAVYGELEEWSNCEPVRDAEQFGMSKALIILGHTASEKFGMEWKAAKLNGVFDGAETKYFDCGDIYKFID